MPLVAYNERLKDLGTKALQRTTTMIAYWDIKLICRFANLAYHYWFGVKPEEMIDKMHMRDLLGSLFEKNLKYINGALSGKEQLFEQMIRTSDDMLKNTRAVYTPDVVNGTVLGFYVFVSDIGPLATDNRGKIATGIFQLSGGIDEMLYDVVQELKMHLLTTFPGLALLAKHQMVSESKLKRDFKHKHGCSIFSYYRKLQMELAENYMNEKKHTKAQLAMMFNFSNPSNFSSCYNRYLADKTHNQDKSNETRETAHFQDDADILVRASEISKTGTWIRNFVDQTTAWNKVSKEILELPSDLFPELAQAMRFHRPDKIIGLFDALLNATMLTGDDFDLQVEMVTGKGNIKMMRVIGFPEYRNGKCEKVCGTIQEIYPKINNKNSPL